MRRALGALALLAIVSSTACGGAAPLPTVRPPSPPLVVSLPPGMKPALTVGVANDLPGLGMLTSPAENARSGFDVEVTRWLGQYTVPGFRPVLTGVNINDRDNAIADGRLGLVIDVFSITDKRRERIGMAGPYLVTRQGILTRAGDTRIKVVDDLAGKNVCVPEGSTSIDQIGRVRKDILLTVEKGNSECAERVLNGQADAYSTDQLILYGFAQAYQGKLAVLDYTFGAAEEYGVGYMRGDLKTCEMIREGIRSIIINGVWDRLFSNNFPALSPATFRPDPEELDPCIQPDQGPN